MNDIPFTVQRAAAEKIKNSYNLIGVPNLNDPIEFKGMLSLES